MTGQNSKSLQHIMIPAITAGKPKRYSATVFLTNRDGYLTSVLKTGSIFIRQKKTSYVAEAEAAHSQPGTTLNESFTVKRKLSR